MMNKNAMITFAVAGVFGASIWGFSTVLTGRPEPWDADSPYYLVALLVAGVLLGLLWPRHILAAYLGIVVGQLAYMLAILSPGPLFPLGVLFLTGYGLIALLGLFLGSRIRQTINQPRKANK